MIMQDNIRKKLLTSISIILLLFIVIWALLSVNGRSVDPNNPNQPITNKGAIRILNKELDKIQYKIFINEQETKLTENSIRNLDAGRYNIKILADKYNTWEANATVVEGQITEISPYLFSKSSNLRLKTKTPINIDSIFFSNYSDYSYFVVNGTNLGSEKGIWKMYLDETSTIFSTNNPTSVKILNIDTLIEPYITTKDYKLISSPDESKILFLTKENKYIFTTDSLASQPNKKIIDIKQTIGFNPQEIYWFKQGNSIIIKDDNLIAELDLSTELLNVVNYSPDSEPIFTVNGDTVYYFDKILQKIILYKDNSKKELSLENQKFPRNIENLWVASSNSNYLILESENNYYYLDIEKSFIDSIGNSLQIIEFSSDGKSLLYSKNNQIYSYYLSEINPLNKYQPKHSLLIDPYEPNNIIVKFNTKSSHILIQTKYEDGSSKLDVIEKNGQNRYELYQGNNLVLDYFSMIISNKELILVLKTDTIKNDNTSNQNTQENHLYSRDLEV